MAIDYNIIENSVHGKHLKSGVKGLYIGGGWHPSASKRSVQVVDPSTETIIAEVPDANLVDAAAAVEAAAKAAPPWAATPPRKRSEILRRRCHQSGCATSMWRNQTNQQRLLLSSNGACRRADRCIHQQTGNLRTGCSALAV